MLLKRSNRETLETTRCIDSTGNRQELPTHRLSAVGLQWSLRARYRGLTSGMADDSSDNAFSFIGHAAEPAAGTQSNSSQSIDTGGSDNSELRTQLPRRALVAPRGRLPSIPHPDQPLTDPSNLLYSSSWKGRREGLWWKRRRVLSPWGGLELHWCRIPTMVIAHDLCIGPWMLGDGGVQSLLKIELYVLPSD